MEKGEAMNDFPYFQVIVDMNLASIYVAGPEAYIKQEMSQYLEEFIKSMGTNKLPAGGTGLMITGRLFRLHWEDQGE